MAGNQGTYGALTMRPDESGPLLLGYHALEIKFDSDFTKLTFTNAATSAITITFVAGYGYFNDFDSVTVATSPFISDSASNTRPNNVTPYAANQYVTSSGGLFYIFSNLCRVNSLGIEFTKLTLTKSSTTTLNADFTAYFYSSDQGITSGADQTTFSMGSIVPAAVVRFNSFVTGGAGSTYSICDIANVSITAKMTQGYYIFYAVLISNAAYVPAANEIFNLSVSAKQF